MKKNLKIYLSIGIVALVIIIAGAILLVNKDKDKPKDVLTKYVSLINSKDYEGMYSMLNSDSQNKISKEDFIKRNKNIYEGIETTEVSVDIKDVKKDGSNKNVLYGTKMTTMGSEITFDNSIIMTKEGSDYKLNWNSKSIFPDLEDDEKVSVKNIKSKRGDILDRNGGVLATDGKAASVGIVTGKLSSNKDESISIVASILGISVDDINTKINAAYVKPDMFIPIKTISNNDSRKESLLKIAGVMINDKDARVYPLGEEAAHLTGYVQSISAEELEEHKDDGYKSSSIIGKSGLEKIYESKIRGVDGFEINIMDKNGKKKSTIASKEAKNGENLKLTIDNSMQSLLYKQFATDKGSSVAMNPTTGEVLALVSTPGYNPNDFVMGISNDKWNSLNNDAMKPLFNRFTGKFAPGSSFKPITAAIGLDSKTLDPNANKNITGNSWQKDKSWGSYSVTRVSSYPGESNLLNALIYSDNIYFAQAALDIGKEKFQEKLNAFGFNEDIPFQIGISKSQYAGSGDIKTDVQLADSGYGQGEVLVSPVHLASMYTMFLNEGNMITPYLEYKETPEVKIWKENACTKDSASTILQGMTQVVSNPSGTGHDAYIDGLTIAGKTGTAEIKASQDDNSGTEIGWFAAMTTNKGNKNLLVVSMVEDVKDRGGSHYVTPKVKTALSTVK